MIFHLYHSSTGLPHYGALLIASSWVSFGSKIFEGDRIQHKKMCSLLGLQMFLPLVVESVKVSLGKEESQICERRRVTYGPTAMQIKDKVFLIQEVQCLCVRWYLASWQQKSESRMTGLQPNVIHLSLHHLAMWKHFFSMATRLWNCKREDEALRALYQPLITLHGYGNCSLWSFHPWSIFSTFSNSPSWSLSPRYPLKPCFPSRK